MGVRKRTKAWIVVFVILCILFWFITKSNPPTSPPNSNGPTRGGSLSLDSLASYIVLVDLKRDNLIDTLCVALRGLSTVKYPIVVLHEKYDHLSESMRNQMLECRRDLVFYQVILPMNDTVIVPETCKYNNYGYRSMCRFFAYDVYRLPIFKNVKYLVRFDHDSVFPAPRDSVGFDPIVFMESHSFDYGFRVIGRDPVECALGMLELTEAYAVMHQMKVDWREIRLPSLVYNNFFVARKDIFLTVEYERYFKFIDGTNGIWTHRWGDHVLHTSAMALFHWKTYHFTEFAYEHGTKRRVGEK